MKIKKIDSKNYRCDKCGSYEKHKGMYYDNICYDCWDDENLKDNK